MYIHLLSTLNNTLITVSDGQGRTVMKASSGSLGFKGSRKSTRNAAQAVGEWVGKNLIREGECISSHLICRGIGSAKEAGIRGLRTAGIQIVSITDQTAIAHNGCRLRKRRRV